MPKQTYNPYNTKWVEDGQSLGVVTYYPLITILDAWTVPTKCISAPRYFLERPGKHNVLSTIRRDTRNEVQPASGSMD